MAGRFIKYGRKLLYPPKPKSKKESSTNDHLHHTTDRVSLTTTGIVRLGLRALEKDFDKSENDIKALQSVGQIIGEVLKQLDAERFIVKASSGPRYVVGCRNKVPKDKLVAGVRVSLDMTTLTIMRILPREVGPTTRIYITIL